MPFSAKNLPNNIFVPKSSRNSGSAADVSCRIQKNDKNLSLHNLCIRLRDFSFCGKLFASMDPRWERQGSVSPPRSMLFFIFMYLSGKMSMDNSLIGINPAKLSSSYNQCPLKSQVGIVSKF